MGIRDKDRWILMWFDILKIQEVVEPQDVLPVNFTESDACCEAAKAEIIAVAEDFAKEYRMNKKRLKIKFKNGNKIYAEQYFSIIASQFDTDMYDCKEIKAHLTSWANWLEGKSKLENVANLMARAKKILEEWEECESGES